MNSTGLTRLGRTSSSTFVRVKLLLSLLLLSPPALAAAPKVAVVDVQAVMDAVPEWKTAIESLTKDLEKKRSKLESDQAVLKAKKEAIDQKRSISDPKALAEEERRLMEDAQKFTQGFMVAQQELSARESKLKDAMLSRVEAVVRTIAVRGDYTFVFETGTETAPNVLYAAPGIDVTQAVVSEYKTAFGGKPIESDPGPAKPKAP